MKTKQIIAVITILSIWLFTSISRAADITATGSGNWSSTVPDAPWPGGIVPNITNDDVDVEAPFVITNDNYAQIQYIYGSGTVVMAPGSTLNVVGDPLGAQGTFQLATLDTSAPSNTVIYSGNSFWAKHQNYYNLVFDNATTNPYDFFNGLVNSQDPAFAMTIAGDMTVNGKVKVQEGADFTINGNLILGTNGTWDCSSFNLTVTSNLTVGGLMLDLDGANGYNYFGGNVIVTSSSIGWNISDVIYWAIGGSLTNNGTIVGKGFGSITFTGTGSITGSKPLKIPTMTINGIYNIGTTITLITNTPTLIGTLVFDIAHTNQIILLTNAGTPLFYSGVLDVINTGPTPVSGHSYQLFNSPGGYAGTFDSTSYPSLPAGLSWVDNLATSGSIAVTGAVLGYPTLALSRNGSVLTLSWDSTTFPGYQVLALTNHSVNGTPWSSTGSGTVSPFVTTLNPANPPVFFRLSNP
ncbi:MAG: hypothetical protein WAO02_06265 [Verrucomicrobiia bacterium]